MSVIALLLTLAVIGLVAWAIVKFIPMPGNIASLIYVVAGIIALLYVLSAFGVIGAATSAQVPKLK